MVAPAARVASSARGSLLATIVLLAWAPCILAQTPVEYRLSFPEPEHRWMQVELAVNDLPPGVVVLHMSRSSPGRYALHEFAKNVFDVRVTDGRGRTIDVTRPNAHRWAVEGHDGTLRITYRVFGDRVDGTYLAIDSTHAHINMPAALMWVSGQEQRPSVVRFEPPAGTRWTVATQLFPGLDPLTFTAPNLQYLMDSPSEFSAHAVRTFRVAGTPNAPLFRLAVHHDGTDAELDAFAADVQKVVTEARYVFGEFAPFDNNGYTFIADYLPWASGDAMEHRNSTFLTSPSSIRTNASGLLGSVAHEFFHSWNVERIRPRALEPFNFDEANVSGELWLAEGFTNYYEGLILTRAGLMTAHALAASITDAINTVTLRPGRLVRTAEEMSRFAPFVDAAAAIDRTSFDNTFISYYTWGEALGLALDLTLRDRSDGRVTLDHYMRTMWRRHGLPGGRVPGFVDNPYTMAQARAALAETAGDAAFAADFFARYIQGHEVAPYAQLLARAGFVLRPRSPDAAYAGDLQVQDDGGRVRIGAAVPFGSPAYRAGLERDDRLLTVGGVIIDTVSAFERYLRAHRPGDRVEVVFERRGSRVARTLVLDEDPRQEVVLVEETAGRSLSMAERQFREQWLGSARNSF